MDVTLPHSDGDSTKTVRWPHPAWAMPAGMLLAYSEIIARLFSGKDMVDSVWPHAVRSLEWTMALRASSATTLSLFFLAAFCAFIPFNLSAKVMFN